MSNNKVGDAPERRPRRSPLAILLLAGILLTLGGGLALALSQTFQVALAADRAEIPDPLQFDAGDSNYRILLLADPLAIQTPFVNGAEAYFLCDIELADGTTSTIDSGSMFSRTETDLGIELGQFDAVAGATTVTCHWKDDRDSSFYYYSVAPSSPVVSLIGWIVLAAGLIALSIAGTLIYRAYTRSVINRRPLSPEGEAAGSPDRTP